MHRFQKALAETVKILDRHQIYWFLEGGSCLGYVREGKILAHDHDIDIGVVCTLQQVEIIINQFPVHKVFKYKDRVTNIAFYLGAYIDFFFFIPYEGYLIETMHNLHDQRIRLYGYDPLIILEGLDKVLFEGVPVNVLKNSTAYCRQLYGESFTIPNKHWNSWADPGNIVHEAKFDVFRDLNGNFNPDWDEKRNTRILKHIYAVLYSYSRDCFDLSFYTGLPGLVLFFCDYADYLDDTVAFNYVQILLKRILDNLKYNKLDYSFLYGYSGIAWMIEYAFQHDFIEGRSTLVLAGIDQSIEDIIENQISQISDDEVVGILKYRLICQNRDGIVLIQKNRGLSSKVATELSRRIDQLLLLSKDEGLEIEHLQAVFDRLQLLTECPNEWVEPEMLSSLLLKLESVLFSDPINLNTGDETYYLVLTTYVRWFGNMNLSNKLLVDFIKYLSDGEASATFFNSILTISIAQKLQLIRIFNHFYELTCEKVFDELVNHLLSSILKDKIVPDQIDLINCDLSDGYLGLGLALIDARKIHQQSSKIMSGIWHTKKQNFTIRPISIKSDDDLYC